MEMGISIYAIGGGYPTYCLRHSWARLEDSGSLEISKVDRRGIGQLSRRVALCQTSLRHR